MTSILLRAIARSTAVILPLIALAVGFFIGFDVAYGVLVGGALLFLDGLGLVYLVGSLLEPAEVGAPRKISQATIFTLIALKFVIVGGLLWVAFSVLNISGIGLAIGILAALVALVIGANQGSNSAEGRRAMEEAERRIREEMKANKGNSEAHEAEDKGPFSS